MLIRKPLYGNLRPNPGDLYDPRDGTCLPNFHLSTTHNPNLAHVTQDLVRYDIQLVREVDNAMPLSGYSREGASNNASSQDLSLTLLAVAEYSEGLSASANNEFPFVVHKVFYREAIAGVLLLRRKISDRDMVLMQNVLRKSIPNPENFKSKLFEQSISSIQKVSIIQHGQEYHYTNIKMAFIEISKIVNFVCSPSNLNARSVLVDIPAVVEYRLLNENKYLAYLYEQERLKKQRDEHKRQQEKHRQELLLMEVQRRQSYQNYRYDQHFTNQSHHKVSSYSQTTDITRHNRGMEGKEYFNGSQTEQSSLDSVRYFVKYPIDTKIQTKNGKKVVTYHRTGRQIIYEPEDVGFNQNGYGILIEDLKKTDTQKHVSNSTPNLADDALYDDAEEDKQSSQIPFGSYLRGRSYSVESLHDRDKIDRYPAPLIEPGRRSVRERNSIRERMDKWKKLSPQYWAGDGNQSFDSTSSDRKETLGREPKKDLSTVLTSNASQSRGNKVSNGYQKPIVAIKSISQPHQLKNPPQRTLVPHGKTQRNNNDDNVSVVSAFSDISITPQQQKEAEKEFTKYYDNENAGGKYSVPATHEKQHSATKLQSTQDYTTAKFQNTNQASGSQHHEYRVYQREESRGQTNQHQQLYDRQEYRQELQRNHTYEYRYSQRSSTHHTEQNAGYARQPPTVHTRPVSLHPRHLQAAEQFLRKHSSDFSTDSHNSSFTDTPPTSLGSLQVDSDSTLTLEQSPSTTPAPSGGHTLDRDFVYRACPAKVREV